MITGATPLLDSYFARIGYAGSQAPRLSVLSAILAKQADAISFEAIDPLLGRPVSLKPEDVDAKLLRNGRGGYCYEQHSLLRRVLLDLGFEVEALLARVVWGMGEGAPLRAPTHQLLRVFADGEWWLVDAGFGHSTPPVPLKITDREPQETVHGAYRLRDMDGDLQVEALIDGVWRGLYRIVPGAWLPVDYECANYFSSTHPTSVFRKRLFVSRTTADTRSVLLGAELTVRHKGSVVQREVLNAPAIAENLEGLFNLSIQPGWEEMILAAAEDKPLR